MFNHQKFMTEAARRVIACAETTGGLAKKCAPFLICTAVVAVRCSAAQSPFGRWLNDLRMEATTTWAVSGAVIGLIIGLLGLKFGGHDAKGKFASLAVTAFALLSVEGIVAYLQTE